MFSVKCKGQILVLLWSMTQLFPNHGQLITISPMGFYIRNRQYWNSTEGSWISTWLPSAEGSSGQSWNEVGDLELRPMWDLLLLLSPTYYHSDTKFKQEDQGIQLHPQRKGLQAPRIFPSPNTQMGWMDKRIKKNDSALWVASIALGLRQAA